MTEVYNASGQYQYGGGGPVPPPIMVPPQAMPMPAAPVSASPVSPAPAFAPAVEPAAEEPADGTAVAEEPRSGGLSLAKKPVEENAPVSGAPVSAVPAASTSTTSGRVAVQVVDRLGTNARRGTTTIPPAVIEKIVTTSTRDVPGVYAFSGATFSEEGERAVTIELDGGKAVVEIRIVVEYGFAVYSVTDKIRTKVIGALENLFALDVTAVNIAIDDIHIAEADAAEQ